MSIHIQAFPSTNTTDVTVLPEGRDSRLYICCDTEAERPTASNCLEGDLAYTHDTDKLWKCTGSAWAEIGGGGGPHATSHQNGGSDEVSIAGLSGLLADGQTPLAHATSHKSGGSDFIKLDELAAPTDVTTLNATTTQHGLLPKLSGVSTEFLNGIGGFTVPAGGGGGGIQTLKKTADQIINGTAYQDITGLTFAVSANTDYAFTFYITFRSAAATTGFRFSINGPASAVVDYHIKHQTIANTTTTLAATWLEGHCVVYNTLTALAATVTANVDLICMITGRIKVAGTAGTLAARVASELANNDLVVQKGSWGTYF